MDVVTTSLDALLQRATNPLNQNIDTAAVEAFCALVNKERDGAHIGVRLLATRIHSPEEKEVIQSLHILDLAMGRCGTIFQGEVGKFRFLNEMIKLVSPKYLGSQTPLIVRQKVLQLMYLWTIDYPKETKIKEAYDMLKKQGVIKEVPLSVSAENTVPERRNNSIFQDEEKSKLLQKLLQSKNPEDLQAANRLIKSMVKEDDKRAEMKSKRHLELESVHNNVRLLNEMLDSYKPKVSSKDELELINELRQSCEKFRPQIMKLVAETQQNEELLSEVLQVGDELGSVLEKYTFLIICGQPVPRRQAETASLLDLGDASQPTPRPHPKFVKGAKYTDSDIDVLTGIFENTDIPQEIADTNVLQPTTVIKPATDDATNKLKALDELNALGEDLLRENLQSSTRIGIQFNKSNDKIPMNLLTKQTENVVQNNTNSQGLDALNLDLTYLLGKSKIGILNNTQIEDNSGDDVLVDITEKETPDNKEDIEKEDIQPSLNKLEIKPESNHNGNKTNDLKLSDIFVKLESIKPSSLPPIKALEENNGIAVTIHIAKDKPHEDVTVMVVTIVNKNENALKNILFRAIVPKTCKVKLQPASGTELPSFNPFLPPSAITQIMLIANPQKVPVSLKFIVSYNIEDETTTEMGEIDQLPQLD